MKSFLARVEDFARASIDSQWEEPFRVAFDRGKRVRPRLVWEFAAQEREMDVASLVPGAAAIELIHAGSLIHDDVVDDDLARRGEPSFYARFGIKQGILFGDYLMSTALRVLAEEYRDPVLVSKTARVLDAMIHSQLMEVEGKVADVPSYWEYIRGKTGALFGLCAHLPFGKSTASSDMRARFAETYGLAFQLADDLSEKNFSDEPNIQNLLSYEDALAVFGEKVNALRSMKMVSLDKLSFMIPIPA